LKKLSQEGETKTRKKHLTVKIAVQKRSRQTEGIRCTE